MTFALHKPHHQHATQQTLLSRVCDAACFKRALMFFVLLVFVGNCQALMQGQGALGQAADQFESVSDITDGHKCCPADEAVEDCPNCLDDRAVKPRVLELSAELETQFFFPYFFLTGSRVVVTPVDSSVLHVPPRFSSYPAIYLTQLHFLE